MYVYVLSIMFYWDIIQVLIPFFFIFTTVDIWFVLNFYCFYLIVVAVCLCIHYNGGNYVTQLCHMNHNYHVIMWKTQIATATTDICKTATAVVVPRIHKIDIKQLRTLIKLFWSLGLMKPKHRPKDMNASFLHGKTKITPLGRQKGVSIALTSSNCFDGKKNEQ